MRTSFRHICAAICFLLNSYTAFTQCVAPKAKQVVEFSADGMSRIAAVLKLGEQEHICIGIEYVDKHSLLDPISISVSNADVEQILHKVFVDEIGYEFIEQGNAMLIRKNIPAQSPNFFTRSISRFTVPRATVQEISNALWMQVQLDTDPNIRGFAGHFPTGNPQDVINGFNERNLPLEQLLLAIVERSRGAAWIATFDPRSMQERQPTDCPWMVLEYGQHWQDSGVLSTIASKLEITSTPR